MAETVDNAQNRNEKDTKSFLTEMKKKSPDKAKLAEIVNNNTELLTSKYFLNNVFPPDKEKLGLRPIDRTMEVIRTVKSLEQDGLISKEMSDKFMDSKDPKTGDTFATAIARNAEVAKNATQVDRSPEPNLNDNDKNVLANQHQIYSKALDELSQMGFDMKAKDRNNQSVEDIQNLQPALNIEVNTPEALNVKVNDELEVGGNQKTALDVKVKPAEKQPVEEPRNEATVEDAPEEDKGKKGDFDWDKIREEDIMKFMYEEWFLAGLNWALKTALGKIDNAVDNLCNSHRKQKKKKQEIKDVSNSQASVKGQAILNDVPKAIEDRLQQNLGKNSSYMQAINDDIKNNIGKNPPQWKVLDMNNPRDQQFVARMQASYRKNPQEFMNRLNSGDGQIKEINKEAMSVYKLAVQMATVQYLNERLNDKSNVDFVNDADPRIQAEIVKKAQKNFEAITVGMVAIKDHTALAMQTRGVTNQEEIDKTTAANTEKYLLMLTEQTGKAKNLVAEDMEKGNFAHRVGRDNVLQTSNTEVRKLNQLLHQTDKAGMILTPGRQEAGLMDIKATANTWNMQRVFEGNGLNEVLTSKSFVQTEYDNSVRRKDNFKNYVKKITGSKDFKNFHDSSNNNFISNIVRSGFGRQ